MSLATGEATHEKTTLTTKNPSRSPKIHSNSLQLISSMNVDKSAHSSSSSNSTRVEEEEEEEVSVKKKVKRNPEPPPQAFGLDKRNLQNVAVEPIGKNLTQVGHKPVSAPPVDNNPPMRKAAVAAAPLIEKNTPNESPFEKLNTLKLLLDQGHLTEQEYTERKNQIINEMTGTSSQRKSTTTTLQPIMKTVVPHAPPDFGNVPKEKAEKLTFDVDTLKWDTSEVYVKIDLVPFATGHLRNAYFMKEVDKSGDSFPTSLLVAKFCINSTDTDSYLSDVEMQAICVHYAQLYNDHSPPLKVTYVKSWLLKLRDRNDVVCNVEEYLRGSYVKYSNNNGFVGKETSSTEDRERNTPQAFSHFTFVASDYRLMVVDIQGVDDSYTDPQIHTADGKGFGKGNLGTYGMEKFLQSHRCNDVCTWLGLKSLNLQFKPGGTAAPAYQMPHGVIQKSTNPITEERNTFSRSVTVSEVLGTTETERTLLLAKLRNKDDSSISSKADASSMSCLLRFFCCCFNPS